MQKFAYGKYRERYLSMWTKIISRTFFLENYVACFIRCGGNTRGNYVWRDWEGGLLLNMHRLMFYLGLNLMRVSLA